MGTLIRKTKPDTKRMVNLPDQAFVPPAQLPASGADTSRMLNVQKPPANQNIVPVNPVTPANPVKTNINTNAIINDMKAGNGAVTTPENANTYQNIPAPTVATAQNPVINRTKTVKEPEGYTQVDYSNIDSMDKNGLQDYVDYYQIKTRKGGSLTTEEERQLMRAQRKLGALAVTAQTDPYVQGLADKQAEKEAKAAELAAKSNDVIAAKQAELDSSYGQQEQQARDAGERTREAAQSVLSFSGFGRSTYSAKQQADIQAATEQNIRILGDKKRLELEKFKAEQNGANEELLQMYDKQIGDLSLAHAKYLGDTAQKINEYNQKSAATYQDKVDDLLTLATMNMSVNDLTPDELNKANTYGELMIDENGNLNDALLKTLPPRLQAAALQAAAKAKGAIPKDPKTTTDGAGNTLQYNPQTGRFDIPVGSNKPAQSADTKDVEQPDGSKKSFQWNPQTQAYDIPVGGGMTGPWETLDARSMANQYPNQARAKNNNPAGITRNSNFDNPKPGTTAYALQQAGVTFTKGTARPANEGGNYVSFNNLGDGMAAYNILREGKYAGKTVQDALNTRGTGSLPGIEQYKNTKVSDLPPEVKKQIQMAQLQKESPGLARLMQQSAGSGNLSPLAQEAVKSKTIVGTPTAQEKIVKELAAAGEFDKGLGNSAFYTAKEPERKEIPEFLNAYGEWVKARDIIEKKKAE